MGLNRIVVLRAGGLGDVLLTLPAVEAIRRTYPRAHLEAMGYPSTWNVAGSMVDGVHAIDSALFRGLFGGQPSSRLAAWMDSIDLMVAWTTKAPVLPLDAATSLVHVSPYPPPGLHAARWLVDNLPEGVTRQIRAGDWRLPLSTEELARGRALLDGLGVRRPIVLHSGSGAVWKRWPGGRFASLGSELRQSGEEVILVQGPADAEVIGEVQRQLSSPFTVLPAMDARELAAVLAAGRAYVGNDSGVTHLASAVGLPAVALFGPTDPAQWSPMGAARVLRTCPKVSTHQGQIRVCDEPACVSGISVQTVLRALEPLLSEPPAGIALSHTD